jgi:hypothetical protein
MHLFDAEAAQPHFKEKNCVDYRLLRNSLSKNTFDCCMASVYDLEDEQSKD